MQTLNLSEFLLALTRTSAQAGLLVVLVLLVQWLFRKQLNPRWRCALWLLVAARLLLPVSLSSAASLFNLLPRPTAAVRAVERAAATASPAAIPLLRQDRVRPTAPPAVMAEAVIPVAPETAASAVQPPIPDTPSTHSQPPTRASAPSAPVPWPLILFGLWGTGVALLAAQLIVSSLRMVRRFGRLPACDDPTVLAVLEECRARVRVKTPLPVAECASVTSPALYGLLRPRLLLPPGFAAKFSAAEMEFVFLHELAHLKRRDLWLNWLFAALQVLHWFNPLVWLAFARWRTDRELACDALALDAAGTGRNRAYGQTILRLLADYSHQPAAPALVGILEDKRQLQQRLRMIANFRPGRRWGVLSVGLLGVLAVVGLTDAQTAKPKNEGPSALSSTAATNAAVAAREVRVGADPVPELTGTDAEVRTLTVTVLDATTGQPIAGAEGAGTLHRRAEPDSGSTTHRRPGQIHPALRDAAEGSGRPQKQRLLVGEVRQSRATLGELVFLGPEC
jgi:beta-lactamase regulating signal transducer with metallopeptidase domain